MDLDLAQGGAVKGEQGTVQHTAEILLIEPGDKLRELLLGDGGGEVDIPRGEAGEGL